jgi:hypothetical protein
MPRNRVIYQSDALFVSTGNKVPTSNQLAADIAQLNRVQSASYGFSINRQNIQQFGNLARIDTLLLEAPSVKLDFTYYLHDGTNEKLLGFTTGQNTGAGVSFISGLVNTQLVGSASGQNFHIFTSPEGADANGLGSTDASLTGNFASTLSIGNGFVTNYSVEASVGAIPTVSISVEGMNINVCEGNSGINPAMTIETSLTGTGLFLLPPPVTGSVGVSALRPGDVTMAVAEGILTDMPTGVSNASNTAAHIQSFSIEVPIKRTTLQRLGSAFGYARVIDFPVDINFNVSATVADLKAAGGLDSILTTDTSKLITVAFKNSTGTEKMVYQLRGCKLVSENYSSSIGDNKKVDLVFTTQIGGPQDTSNGLFVSATGLGSSWTEGL